MILAEIGSVLERVDETRVESLIEAILSARAVFLVGVGRVFLSLQAMAKRLFHLGIDVHLVGDINEPACRHGDLLIVGSGSGESIVPLSIAERAKQVGATVVHIGADEECALAKYRDMFVRLPAPTKRKRSKTPSFQPMSSLFEQSLLIFSDTVALMIMRRKGIDHAVLEQTHANLE
ncbi:MAG: sugar isomerase [Spirochaetes bacterium]|nr:sugar isomerase [Spirochaetota bacterium]